MFRVLRSIKLAVVLITLLVLFAVIGGTLVQKAPAATYFEMLPPWAAKMMLFLELDRVFTSPLFLTVSGLFLINLTACSFHRLRRELRKPTEKGKKHFGPDLLHLGLIVLLIGGVITAVFRGETTVFLAKGESVKLPKELELTLLEFRAFSYNDNRPKDWISTVSVERGGKAVLPSKEIEVNHPLRIAGYTIYQSSYDTRTTAFFTHNSNAFHIRGGETLSLPRGEGKLFFMALAGQEKKATEKTKDQSQPATPSLTGVFLHEKGEERNIHRIEKGESIGDFTLSGIEQEETTGLKVVRDPGYPVVLIGVLVIGLGLFLTYYGKIGKAILKEDR